MTAPPPKPDAWNRAAPPEPEPDEHAAAERVASNGHRDGGEEVLDEDRFASMTEPPDEAPTSSAQSAVAGLSAYFSTVLDEVREHLARYVLPLADADLDVLTLWAAHTHLMKLNYTTPRLILTSPLPESGKTTVLEHFERLCFHAVNMASAGSPALFARMLHAGMRTLMIDEADRNLRPDRDGVEDALAVLNTGYKRGGTRPVLERGKDGTFHVVEMPTFAPLVMAGIAPDLPDDTLSRTVTVTMLPDLDGKVAESDWELIDAQVVALADRLAAACQHAADLVRSAAPELPDRCIGRMREKWKPLARVAAAAGPGWLNRCRHLIERDLDERDHNREEGLVRERPEISLLHDVVAEWPPGVDFWPADAIRMALATRHPDRWGPSDRFPHGITAQRLGRYLGRTFRIRSVRPTSVDERRRVRGYLWSDVEMVARRLGVDRPDVSGQTGQSGHSGQETAS